MKKIRFSLLLLPLLLAACGKPFPIEDALYAEYKAIACKIPTGQVTPEILARQLNAIGMTQPDGMCLVVNPPAIRGIGTAGGFEFYLQNHGEGGAKRLAGVNGTHGHHLSQFMLKPGAAASAAAVRDFFFERLSSTGRTAGGVSSSPTLGAGALAGAALGIGRSPPDLPLFSMFPNTRWMSSGA